MAKVFLTDKLVRSLVTTKPREEFWDTSLAGFGIRVTHTGIKTFFLRYRMGGREASKVWLTIGSYPQLSLADARSLAKIEQGKIELGVDPREERKARETPAAVLMFEELAAHYLERHPKKGTRFWEEQKRIIERELVPRWKGRPADAIRKGDVTDVLDETVARGAPIQANRTRAIVRRLYNYGISKDLVLINPVLGTERPAEEVSRERVLSADELRTAWSGFDGLSPSLGLHFRLKLYTLQRGSEILTMGRPHVAEDWWTIPRELTKMKRREHRVYLVPSACRVLEEALEVCAGPELFFPSIRDRTRPMVITAPAKACRRICERHGIAPFTPHDLRRTAATIMGSLGVDERTISRILGHTMETAGAGVPKVTGTYNRHRYDAAKRGALLIWEQHLNALLAGEEAHSESEGEPAAGSPSR